MIGQLVGSYKIQSVVKETSLWVEYLAQHQFLPKRAVVKALLPNLAGVAEARTKFQAEIQQLLQLQHAHLPVIYDMIETPENLYVITEQIQGKNLYEYLEQETHISEEKALRLFVQMLDALALIHKKGNIWKNLDEENIFILGNQVKITDAEKIQISDSYKSPEEIKTGIKSKEGNIFGLGILLKRIVGANLTNPNIRKAITKATSEKPSSRFESCEAFRKALVGDASTTNIEEINEEDYFTRLPLYLFIGLFLVVSVVLYRIAQTEERPETLTYNLNETPEIKKQIDSTKKVKRIKQVADSTNNLKNTKKDTAQTYVHKVKKGETLQGIAVRYGLSVAQIQKINGLTSKSVLKEAMGLRIPIFEIHKVLAKENLDMIAQKYNINRYEILRANAIIGAVERKEIYEGRDLIIPLKSR